MSTKRLKMSVEMQNVHKDQKSPQRCKMTTKKHRTTTLDQITTDTKGLQRAKKQSQKQKLLQRDT